MINGGEGGVRDYRGGHTIGLLATSAGGIPSLHRPQELGLQFLTGRDYQAHP